MSLRRCFVAVAVAAAAVVALAPSSARARTPRPPQPAPLERIPIETLRGLAPILRGGDLALIESGEKGALKQLTTISLAAAPPEVVHEVVAHPERYREFVRNTKECTVKQLPDGGLWHQYAVGYGIYTVDGRHQYTFGPPPEEGMPGVIEMHDPDDGGVRHFRWELIPALGGTLVVLYGYQQIPRDNLLDRFLRAAPTLEHGLALITQMTLILAMKTRAEELAGRPALAPGKATGSYAPLLERGVVALFRTAGGRLSDISLVARSSARPDVVTKVAGEPNAWSGFIPTVVRSTPVGMKEGVPAVEIEQSLPLVSWTSTLGFRADGKSVDLFGLGGDLKGGRMRWDVRPIAPSKTEIVLRAVMRYDVGSMIVRQLYKLEPFFEYGINVGLGLVLLEGVRGRAEALTRTQATR